MLSIVILNSVFLQSSLFKIVLIILSLAFAVLLYNRCVRFAKLRYIYIFREFYYKVVVKNLK